MDLSKGVYWCSRDLDGSFIGNHQFVLLIGDSKMDIFPGVNPKCEKKDGKDYYFCTISAAAEINNPTDWGMLQMKFNDNADVTSVIEGIDPDEHVHWNKADYDIESHKITELSVSDFSRIRRLLENYSDNQNNHHVHGYDLSDLNCATWVNTLFKALEISAEKRENYGEFDGVDWGEEDSFDITYFTNLVPDSSSEPITNIYLSVTSGGKPPIIPNNSYRTIPIDLNKGAGGKWIYLSFTRETGEGEPIKMVLAQPTSSSSYTPPPKYNLVQNNLGTGKSGDLNAGANTNTKIFMSYSRENNPNSIYDLMVVEGDRPALPGWVKLDLNLNAGTNGKMLFLYITYKYN